MNNFFRSILVLAAVALADSPSVLDATRGHISIYREVEVIEPL